jgi:hypothetical protein
MKVNAKAVSSMTPIRRMMNMSMAGPVRAMQGKA